MKNVLAIIIIMTNKQQVELKEIFNPCGKPYLFLIKQEESKVHIVSSYDKDFYKEFIKLKEDYCNDTIACSKEIKELLDKDISYLLDSYRFNEEFIKEGKDLYRYEEFMKIEKEAETIRKNTLYDWSLFKDGDNYQKNYINSLCELTGKGENLFYSILIYDDNNTKIAINRYMENKYVVYFEVNSFVTGLHLINRNYKKFSYTVLRQGKEEILKTKDGVSIKTSFFRLHNIEISRHLLMPYEEMIKVIKSNDSSDIYELLDYIEEKIHSNYPREEIKKHLLDCIFVKEYEEKHKEGVKKYEKNLFQRLRKLF